MIKKTTNGDISDEEFNAILKPFLDNYDEYIESYVIPEVIAYYIANSYYRNAMYEGSFLQHYNSAKDLINMFFITFTYICFNVIHFIFYIFY